MKTGHLHSKKVQVSGHLRERRGYYHMALSWMDKNGERVRKSISTGLPVKGNKKRAEEMLRAARKEQQERISNMPDAGELLFADFMEQWLDVIKPDIKLTTFGGYQTNVQKTIAPYFREHGILLHELTASDVNEFYKVQLKRVTAMTVTKLHANISKALKYAVEKEWIPFSIMSKVNRPKPERFVGKFLRQSEAVELFDTVKGHKLELAVILGAFYGLRRSEIIGLRWESIDFEANTITIEHTVTQTHIDGKLITIADDTTKSKASLRSLPLVPGFRAKLLAVKEEQEKNRKLCGKSYNSKEAKYIYTDVLGNRIKPSYLTNTFPEFMVKHGFKRLRLHDLRHSCASLLLANSVPLKQIQEWLGHSDFTITANTYAHLDISSKVASAKAMTWFDKTSLGQGEGSIKFTPNHQSDVDYSSEQYLPDFMHGLLCSGVPFHVIQDWLKQADFTSIGSLDDSFKSFAKPYMVAN